MFNFSVHSVIAEPTGEPTNLDPTKKVDRVDFTWQAPSCGKRNGEITRYEYIATDGEGNRRPRGRRYSILDLSNGDEWTFKVRACNDAGCGPYAVSSGHLN